MARPLPMKGMLVPRERVWQAVRSFGEGGEFTAMELQECCKPMVLFDLVEEYLRDLAAAGYLQVRREKLPKSAGNRTPIPHFRVVKTSFEAPQVGRSGQALQGMGVLAMWRMMRVLKTFDFRELSSAATQGDVIVSETTARKYLAALLKAGYLKCESPRNYPEARPARYRLIKFTGHHAPAVTRVKSVFDRNLGEFTWQQSAQEVCDGLE